MRAERLLILGGTAEGRAFASAAEARFGASLQVISALAGVTRDAAAARRYRPYRRLRRKRKASPPICARSGSACSSTPPIPSPPASRPRRATPPPRPDAARLVLVRPPWRQVAGDRWIEVATVADAAAAIPTGARRVFLTVGARALAPFAGRDDLWFLVRLVDEPAAPVPLARHRLICARGPFAEADERALLAVHGIDCLVTRASGGDATAGKLAAARALSGSPW